MAARGEQGDFAQGKLSTARYVAHWDLPRTEQRARLLQSLDATLVDVQDTWF